MKAKDLDKKFDSGEDITEFLDLSKARRPGLEQKRVNVDFPVWMIHSLDREAKRLGVPRQSIIKIWIAERLKDNIPQLREKRVGNKRSFDFGNLFFNHINGKSGRILVSSLKFQHHNDNRADNNINQTGPDDAKLWQCAPVSEHRP